MNAYDSLADWFEYLNDDCDYKLWSQYFIRGLEGLQAGKRGLELGCGSGAFCRALQKRGYLMTGGDISAPMLQKANELSRKEGLQIPFVQMDALKPQTLEKYDFILAPNDCYNYLSQKNLPVAFKRIANCLKKGGVFWFDVSSEYKLRSKVANNMSVDDREDVTYLSLNTLVGEGVQMDVTLFIKGADGRYERADETHYQYIHREEEIASALREAGFEVLSVEGHLGEDKKNSDRLNFICRKR